MSVFEDIEAIEILKGYCEKLVVKPTRYGGHVNVNVGIQTFHPDKGYRYKPGGFNVWSSVARELAEALFEMAQLAEWAEARDNFDADDAGNENGDQS